MLGEFVATRPEKVHQLEFLKPEESFLHIQDLESSECQSARYPAKK
jgi:hypothetical protein